MFPFRQVPIHAAAAGVVGTGVGGIVVGPGVEVGLPGGVVGAGVDVGAGVEVGLGVPLQVPVSQPSPQPKFVAQSHVFPIGTQGTPVPA